MSSIHIVDRSKDAIVRLFVDDQREPEWFGLEGWTVARTSAEAIAILSRGRVVECSLDHDLGGDDTGYKVACWMEANGVWPKDGTRCHSANPVGKQRIEAAIRKSDPALHRGEPTTQGENHGNQP